MPDNSEPKIIVDDDWKARVQKEREEAKRQAKTRTAATPSAQDENEIPPASFEFLITTYYMQAMTAIGLLADPVTKKAMPNRPWAKHIIDTLGMLEEKTRGNLSTDEADALTQVLHQLRMLYVAPPPSADEPASPKTSSLELP